MRKNIIKFLICILTICGFCGLLNIKTAKALEIPDSVGGPLKFLVQALEIQVWKKTFWYFISC